jgi:hypothetical protein
MNLYIEIENGVPKNHPAFENNLFEAFGEIPANWEKFVCVERPIPDEYELLESDVSAYQKINDTWTDVWLLRTMTAEEKVIKNQEKKQNAINNYKASWAQLPQRDNFSAWVFNEETIKYEPPIPRPNDREVIWSGANNGWIDKPIKPNDGKEYTLDFYTSTWVEVTQ